MGENKPAACAEDNVGGTCKLIKKAAVNDDGEYSVGTDSLEEKSVLGEEHVAPFAGKKVNQFKAYIDNCKEEKKREAAKDAVFPCVLQIMPNCVFNNKDPIILDVDVIRGILKIGTPICVPRRDFIDIGRISSIENNHRPVEYAKKGQKVSIKITGTNVKEHQKISGRHFEIEDELVSRISRNSIDLLKAYYRDELTHDEWKLVVTLKHLFKIQ